MWAKHPVNRRLESPSLFAELDELKGSRGNVLEDEPLLLRNRRFCEMVGYVPHYEGGRKHGSETPRMYQCVRFKFRQRCRVEEESKADGDKNNDGMLLEERSRAGEGQLAETNQQGIGQQQRPAQYQQCVHESD